MFSLCYNKFFGVARVGGGSGSQENAMIYNKGCVLWTLPGDPFFLWFNFGVTRDSAQYSSKIFVEHALPDARIQFRTQP